MRKTIYYCDRCKKEIEEKPLSFEAVLRRSETGTVEDVDGVTDICESCANDLMERIRKLILSPDVKEKPKKEAKKQMVDRGKVVALAKAKWSVAKIADEMRCSQQTVRNILRACMTEDLKKEADDGKKENTL